MPTLNWLGKDKVINHHADVPFCLLDKKYTHGSPDSGNMLIKGDNLLALKALLPRYEGRVKCIYIDPPYNTGNENWVYNDNVNDPKIKKWLGEVVGKEGEDLSRHDKWLCMMYPRLRLLQRLLADDGAIFISIDDNEQANLKLICDEIFGANNFITNVIWQKKHTRSNDARWFSDNHDFILLYAKNKELWNRNLIKRGDIGKAYVNPDNDVRGVWASGPCHAKTPNEKYIYSVTSPTGKTFMPPLGTSWRFSENKFKDLIADNHIWFGKNGDNVPRYKRFLTETQDGFVPTTLWFREDVGDNQLSRQQIKNIFPESIPFSTPKPTTLINHILQISTNPSDIILDSFAGSGTTAHAVINLNKQDNGNRKFILIEMEDYAENITAERVRRVIDGYSDKPGTGGGFGFYELGEPLLFADGNINENVDVALIHEYIWYTETKAAYTQQAEQYLLGVANNSAYYFYYEREKITTLDRDFLRKIKTKADGYLIYADLCALSEKTMQKHNITFKKIPRDIGRI